MLDLGRGGRTPVEALSQADDLRLVLAEQAVRTEVGSAVGQHAGRDKSGLEVDVQQFVELCSCELVRLPLFDSQCGDVLGIEVCAIRQERIESQRAFPRND